MTDIQRRIKRTMTSADDNSPAFDEIFGRAEVHAGQSRRRRRSALGLAAAVALAALLLPSQSPESPGLISDEELFGTTSWSPPSDVLLPSRETDIFYELPALPGSTEPAGGALL